MCLDFQGFQYKKIATSWFRLFECVAKCENSSSLDGFSASPSMEGFYRFMFGLKIKYFEEIHRSNSNRFHPKQWFQMSFSYYQKHVIFAFQNGGNLGSKLESSFSSGQYTLTQLKFLQWIVNNNFIRRKKMICLEFGEESQTRKFSKSWVATCRREISQFVLIIENLIIKGTLSDICNIY